jgi:L-seryl-tRNA(Ser) seleniumtransferase
MAIRTAVADARRTNDPVARNDWQLRIESALLNFEQRSLRKVINGTGVILHTNLGRAPLPAKAIEAIRELAQGYTNLEYDLHTGKRGSRYTHCVDYLRELTGAEDAIVVNNCAAALVLSLSALARGREVIVSRGELVEIGGSFRVPDIMARSGAQLVEVGTTNRTHPEDYVRAISSRTGAIAKVHRSNFAQSGFVADVEVRSLAPIAAEHGIPIVHDLGSGLMIDLSDYGLSGEPTARAALEAGASVVLMSGDKLLGGPQAGIALGTREAIGRMRQDPFARAMRVDKMTIAALTATLELYREPETAVREIPALRMIAASAASILERCEHMVKRLNAAGINAVVKESVATVGAGAFPIHGIPSFSVSPDGNADLVGQKLRSGAIPVIGRIDDDRFSIDLRTVDEAADALLIDAIIAALT